MSQKLTSRMASRFFAVYTIKVARLDAAVEMAMPDKISRSLVARPPIFARKSTKSAVAKAKQKAETPTPILPKAENTPRTMARVAPKDAPDEIPKI